MKTYRGRSIVSWLAPVASAALLLAAAVLYREPPAPSGALDAYHASVKREVESIPLVIGEWVGRDVEPQPEARELLRPNVIRQIRYEHVDTGEVMQLLIVHCRNTMDMLGHFPPMCYPNAGWEYDAETDREPVTILLDGRAMPAMRYTFSRFESGLNAVVSLSVLNFFATPNGALALQATPSEVDEMSRSRRLASLGAANVQLLSSRPLELGPGSVVERVVSVIEPALVRIMNGAHDEQRR